MESGQDDCGQPEMSFLQDAVLPQLPMIGPKPIIGWTRDLRTLAPGTSLVRFAGIMEHSASPDAHTHPGVAATDRRTHTGSSATRDPAALIDTNADTDRAHACADPQIHTATASTDAQRNTWENGHTNARSGAHGGACDQKSRSATDHGESE